MIKDLDEKCVMDGQHAHGRGAMFNPDEAPGPMCEKHANQWRRENDKQTESVERDYTHPDKRTPSWRERQAQREAYYRHKIQCGCNNNL
jgi:hypothetical protein